MINLKELVRETKNLKVLFVEDDRDSRESTLLILNDLFDDIIIAEDGKDGLEKFKNNNINLVITDISMPIMDGLEMCKSIRNIDYTQPIIILTALTDLSIIKEAIDINIDSFINKPLEDVDILLEKLNKIIKQINYEKTIKNLEKVQTILTLIKTISHHWKQPLSTISSISSGYSFKLENEIEITKEDLKKAKIITQKVDELSNIFYKLDKINLEEIDLNELDKLIDISNPVY